MPYPGVLGLTWIALLVTITPGAAQTRSEHQHPPIRLPGIAYPDQTTKAAPTSPELRSKGRRSQPAAALVTPASPPTHPSASFEAQPPRRAGSLPSRNEPETTAAVTMGSETVGRAEPLALATRSTPQFMSSESITVRGVALASLFVLASASLVSAGLALVRGRRVWAS